MAVTFDNAATATGAAVTGISATLTVGSGANRAIVAGIALKSGGSQPTGLAISGAGATWTQAKGALTNWQPMQSGNAEIAMWVGTAPSSGSQTVTVSWTNATDAVLVVSTYAGVNQTTSFGNDTSTGVNGLVTTSNIGSTAVDAAILWMSPGEMIVDMLIDDGGSPTVSGGDSSQVSNGSGTVSSFSGGSSRAANTGPTISVGWTFTSGRCMQACLTLLPTSFTPTFGTFLVAAGKFKGLNQKQTGTQSIVGLGFTPWLICISYGYSEAGGISTFGGQLSYGFACRDAAGGIHQFAQNAYQSDSNVSPTSNAMVVRTDDTAVWWDIIPQKYFDRGAVQSFDTDGFTINWAEFETNFPDQFWWWAIGGADITNATIVTWTDATTTGNKSVTGAGFKPAFGFFFDTGITAAIPFAGTTGSGVQYGFGVAKDTTHRWATGAFGQGGVTTTNTARQLKTDHCHILMTPSVTGSPTVSADFVSWDTDGFTLNYDVVSATAFKSFAVLLNGTFQSAVGNFTQPATTGTQTISTPFLPVFEVFSGDGRDTSYGNFEANTTFGVATSTFQWAAWSADENALAASGATGKSVMANGASYINAASDTGTVNGRFSVSAQNVSGFTINWTTSDGTTSRVIPYLAFGASPGWSGPAGVIPGAPGRVRVWSIFPSGR